MSVKQRVKKELAQMKRGAKILPSFVAEKGKAFAKRKWQEAQEQRKAEAALQVELSKIRREAYKEELKKQARIQGLSEARRTPVGKGSPSWQKQAANIGEALSLQNLLGLPAPEKKKKHK